MRAWKLLLLLLVLLILIGNDRIGTRRNSNYSKKWKLGFGMRGRSRCGRPTC